jgi:hypothetical protein
LLPEHEIQKKYFALYDSLHLNNYYFWIYVELAIIDVINRELIYTLLDLQKGILLIISQIINKKVFSVLIFFVLVFSSSGTHTLGQGYEKVWKAEEGEKVTYCYRQYMYKNNTEKITSLRLDNDSLIPIILREGVEFTIEVTSLHHPGVAYGRMVFDKVKSREEALSDYLWPTVINQSYWVEWTTQTHRSRKLEGDLISEYHTWFYESVSGTTYERNELTEIWYRNWKTGWLINYTRIENSTLSGHTEIVYEKIKHEYVVSENKNNGTSSVIIFSIALGTGILYKKWKRRQNYWRKFIEISLAYISNFNTELSIMDS